MQLFERTEILEEIEVDGFSRGVKLDPMISYGLQKAPFEDLINEELVKDAVSEYFFLARYTLCLSIILWTGLDLE